MKRTPPPPTPGRGSVRAYMVPALRNFTTEQLAGIGSVAVAYNEAEELLDDLVRIGWQIKFDPKEILTRIGGLDGKIHLIKHAAKVWRMPDEMLEALSFTLGANGFETLKKFRDGVIHARVHDHGRALGFVVERRNRPAEVLLSAEALNGLSVRLEWLMREVSQLKEAYQAIRDHSLETDDQRKDPLATRYQAAMAQYHAIRTHRQSLPPLPEFPDEPSGPEFPDGPQGDQFGQTEPSA